MSFVKEFFNEYGFEFSIAFPVLAFLLSFIYPFSLPTYSYNFIWFKLNFLVVDIIFIILFIFVSPIRFYLSTFQNTVNLIEPDDLVLKKGKADFYFIKLIFGKRKLQKLKKSSKKGNPNYELIIKKPDFIYMKPKDILPGQFWDDSDKTRCKLVCSYNMEKQLSIVFKIFSTVSLSEIRNLYYEIEFYFKDDKEKKIYKKNVEITNSK